MTFTMRWVFCVMLALSFALAKEEDNELKPKINLDANLRRALLKALTDLENEENDTSIKTTDKYFEKASASALSIFASTTPTIETTSQQPTAKPIVVIQKSNGESFITSASSSSASKYTNNFVTTTTTTTKPASSTTETVTTEENEAKVEDVQFFSAPLVAAFTVHQDHRGLPKKVEPIFKPQKIEATTQHVKPTQSQQFQFEQKQKALENEILRLKEHQQHQNYLIRQQQILHEQQLQLQRQKLIEEQNRLFYRSTTQRNEFDNNRAKSNGVSFQPSISFNQPLPVNSQHVPVKNAVDFTTAPKSNFDYQPFNYLSQQQPPLPNSVSTFNAIQPQVQFTTPKPNFVENFDRNKNFGHFQQHNGHRFFRSNLESSHSFNQNQLQPPAANYNNQQLRSLLYNSGFIQNKPEDLNIISKVLSLNHYGGDVRLNNPNL